MKISEAISKSNRAVILVATESWEMLLWEADLLGDLDLSLFPKTRVYSYGAPWYQGKERSPATGSRDALLVVGWSAVPPFVSVCWGVWKETLKVVTSTMRRIDYSHVLRRCSVYPSQIYPLKCSDREDIKNPNTRLSCYRLARSWRQATAKAVWEHP